MSFKLKQARSCTIMLAAGMSLDEVLGMAKSFGLRSIHFMNLVLPKEELAASKQLINLLRVNK